jgi:uncharacterized protein (DUF608 family)
MVLIQQTIAHSNGIPLGGIGTGSIEIWPDGYLHDWEIFNLGIWANKLPGIKPKKQPTNMDPAGLQFFLRTCADGGQPQVRRLGMRTDVHDLYNVPWAKSVEAIEYSGTFPIASLKYTDNTIPVSVSAKFFSPFIPHDIRASGTPGFYAWFTIVNDGPVVVDVSLMGILANPLAIDAKDRKLKNTIEIMGDTTALVMRTSAMGGFPATHGSLALSVTGGEVSWIATEFSQYFKGNRTFWPENTNVSALHVFRAKGRMPNLGVGLSPVRGLAKYFPKGKTEAKKAALVEKLRSYAMFHELMEIYDEADPSRLNSPEGRDKLLMSATGFLAPFFINHRLQASWGDGALCTSLRLEPGETKEICFMLGWFFPNHISRLKENIGHAYANWFGDAADVIKYLSENAMDFKAEIENFTSTLFDTTLDPELADAWAAQLTTIPKCTWFLRDMSFGVWEGLGCCGFHTTDITYQGSFNLLALFPDLQLRQMLMGARFQRADGRVPHFFTPDLYHVDRGFDRVDMNSQFVLLCCRDYLWTADRTALMELWPHIVRAMDNSQQLDTDNDGLPDRDTRRNTYDGWNFFGTPSYIASLWIGALKAAVHVAEALEETSYQEKWQALLDKAVPAFEQKLWNGEYFSLWVDGDRREDMCMTDQTSGEWFTRLIGLGNSLPAEKVQAALRAVFKHNFSAENGLINASYPPGKHPMMPASHNVQALAPWTGVEYAIGSMMIDHGLVDEGKAVVKNIHDRYLRAGRFWNHVECGDHYYRAMCSWAVLLAATGFKVDREEESYTFAPIAAGRAPFVSSSAWGSFTLDDASFSLEVKSGSLEIKHLHLMPAGTVGSATLGGESVSFTQVNAERGAVSIDLAAPVTLKDGDRLEIALE